MISLTPPQRTLLESSLYIATAGLLWNGRKIAVMSPPTLQYGVIAISHVAFSKMIEIQRRYPPEHPLQTNICGILIGSLATCAISALLNKKISWIKPDANAFWGTMFGSMVMAVLVDCIVKDKAADSGPSNPTDPKKELHTAPSQQKSPEPPKVEEIIDSSEIKPADSNAPKEESKEPENLQASTIIVPKVEKPTTPPKQD